ncbi:MAG TPA: hypothetical protein PKD72_04795, partial [Gemmatales bacterium]|nr:hypothetical protein [Gemmatales bacterium]
GIPDRMEEILVGKYSESVASAIMSRRQRNAKQLKDTGSFIVLRLAGFSGSDTLTHSWMDC